MPFSLFPLVWLFRSFHDHIGEHIGAERLVGCFASATFVRRRAVGIARAIVVGDVSVAEAVERTGIDVGGVPVILVGRTGQALRGIRNAVGVVGDREENLEA